MARWEATAQADQPLVLVGDNQFSGMDMKTPDASQMTKGTYREGYNVRVENGGLIGRLGSICPGAFNYIQYNRIYGLGRYSNPNGLDWEVVGVSSGAWFIRDGEAARFIPYPAKQEYLVEFDQAFDKLFMMRGETFAPLIWGGDWNQFWGDLPPPAEVQSVTGQWRWRNTAISADGQITTDTFDWSSAVTKVDVSKHSVDGTDASSLLLGVVRAGDVIKFEDATNLNNWVLYTVNFTGIDQGTYVRYAVSWNKGSDIVSVVANNALLNVTVATIDTSRKTIPNSDTAEYYANRLLVPYGKDRIAVSDIGDPSKYDWFQSDFQINSGEADSLIRIFPWINSMVIIFKSHSIYKVDNVTGDLSQTSLDQISASRGLCGRQAVVDVGGDIMFMDFSGVFAISQQFVNTPSVRALPLSDTIKPMINSINWTYAAGIRANCRRERVYFAVPVKNAARNNLLLVYNLVTNSWESFDTFADPEFRVDDLLGIVYNGERRLFAVDRLRGIFLLLEQGKTDIIGMSTAFQYQIQSAILSRGYLGAGTRSRFERLQLDTASWNPDFSVHAFVDGSGPKALIPQGIITDRTKYEVWARAPWNARNDNDDHAHEYRQDYSVKLPFRLGYHGIQFEREQSKTNRFTVRMKGRYIQYRIENEQGFLAIRSVITDTYEDQRQTRSVV